MEPREVSKKITDVLTLVKSLYIFATYAAHNTAKYMVAWSMKGNIKYCRIDAEG
jgi:hypothetical protein